jgi:uncharacterized protein (DUF2062 family)/SAM-dependent methyltransferase
MSAPAANSRDTIAARFRRTFYGLRTEGSGPGREAVAIGVGVFLGCLPFYGFHLLMCWAVGTVFRLNRLKVYLAANISNPLVAPWLILAELQAGALVRNGSFQAISPHAIRSAGLSAVGVDLLVGSLVVGGVLALIAGGGIYATLRGPAGDSGFTELVRRASDRYVGSSITAWEFARGKLRNDPLYRATLFGKLLPSGGTLLDVGCGQGLTLALLAEARRAVDEGIWPPSSPVPPRFDRMIGVEIRPRVAELARAALAGDADIVHSDARALAAVDARAVLLFDVLHLLDADEQDAILVSLAKTLDRQGVMLVRDADAGGGWRFRAVRLGNRLKALAVGVRGQRFCFRTRDEWLECFDRNGFEAEVQPMGQGTPFANLLFRLTVKPNAFESIHPHGPPG